VNAADSLLQTVGVPRQLIIDQRVAVALKVETFRSSICGEQKTCIGVVETALRIEL